MRVSAAWPQAESVVGRLLGRDRLHHHVSLPDQHVGVRSHLDGTEQDPARRGQAVGRHGTGTVHEDPAGRSAFASVTLTEPKAGLVKTST